MSHPVSGHPLASLFNPRTAHSRRASSWDQSGANQDFIQVQPDDTVTLLEHEGPGCITHVYCAMVLPDVTDYRDAILRCYWDGANDPSVEVPLGDLFGIVNGRVREYRSSLTAVNAGLGSSHGLNAYFPMPFDTGATVTLEHRGPETLGGVLGAFWYHIEYETYDTPLPEGTHRFHASYRQEKPTEPSVEPSNVTLHEAANLDGSGNYVALDTEGQGRMVGLMLGIDNQQGKVWYGEGDDMAFIDGEQWPPSIHGTGTEEIFGGGACPAWEYAGPYTGFHLIESMDYSGLVGMYRWYIHDGISFQDSLRWTIEHGHANNFANNYSSVAYWYQDPIVSVAGTLPGRDEMTPRLEDPYPEARDLLERTANEARELGAGAYIEMCQRSSSFYRADWQQALTDLKAIRRDIGLT